MVKKKGLSPIIATVLLIALVLVLILIIFMWARGFLNENIQKGGKNIEEVCKDVSFEMVSEVSDFSVSVSVVNRGNIPINKFDVKTVSGGDSTRSSYAFNLNAGESGTQDILIDADVGSLVLYPVIVGTVQGKTLNKEYTCLEKGQVIRI